MFTRQWILLFILDLMIYWFHSFKMGAIFFVILFCKILWDIGFFKSVIFNARTLNRTEIYYKEFTGNYKNIGKEFEKLTLLITKFKLSKDIFSTFGLYYDNPKEVNPDQCRAIIGIISYPGSEKTDLNEINIPEDMIDFLISFNFKKSTFPETPSIYTSFPFVNVLSIFMAIKKVYSQFERKKPILMKEFNLDIKSCKEQCSLEIYSQDAIHFYFPLKNKDRFRLHSSLKK
jgi:hypothetical protein